MKIDEQTEIRYIENADKAFWFTLDKHLSESEFRKKVRDKQGYILLADGSPVGILRYNLFWDNTPFCTLLFIADGRRNCGFGKALMRRWERDMAAQGHDILLVSTRSDEDAQHFYRAIGYTDCGRLALPDQPDELFLSKALVDV